MAGSHSLSRFNAMLAKEQRDIERLVRAAWGVGVTHSWFRGLNRKAQETKVQEWVEEAREAAQERRARLERDHA